MDKDFNDRIALDIGRLILENRSLAFENEKLRAALAQRQQKEPEPPDAN